jgi:hypothetical protein
VACGVFVPGGAGDRTLTDTPLGNTAEPEKKDRVPEASDNRRRREDPHFPELAQTQDLPLHFLPTREHANDV